MSPEPDSKAQRAAAPTVSAWSERASEYVLSHAICPRCDADLGGSSICPSCQVDLRGREAALVRQASERAGEWLLERHRLIAALPTARDTARAEAAPAASVAAGSNVASAARPLPSKTEPQAGGPDAASDSTSLVSVQSVLAVTGAGLLAIAAIVFTFLNPDVGFGMRTTVIAVVTVAFLGGAWLLCRRGVRFSAEAIGALGAVFLALDVQALSELAPATVNGWVLAALGTLVAAFLLLAVGWLARIRTWWWTGLAGLVLVPAFFGYAFLGHEGGGWATAWGHVGVIAVALAAHELLRPASARFDSDLRADHTTLTVLQWIGTVFVLVQLPFLYSVDQAGGVLARVALLVALALLAAFATRNGGRGVWSFTAGTLATAALAVLPLAPQQLEPSWLPALVPLGAAVVLAASGLLRRDRLVRPRAVQAGALIVALGTALPAMLAILFTCGAVVSAFATSLTSRAVRNSARFDAVPVDAGIAAVLGVVAVAAGAAVLAFATRSERADASADALDAPAPAVAAATPSATGADVPTVTGVPSGFPVGLAGLATWLLGLAAAGFIGWSAFFPITQSLVGISIALFACAAALVPWGRFAWARSAARIPLIVLAHGALLEAAFVSWVEQAITVPVGALLVAALLVVMRTMPGAARPVHVGLAYAYALVLFATALDRAGVMNIAVLCLTTTLAAVVALAATLVRRVDARSWYAILVVTFVPFVIAVASVLGERSGWTALSTGVMFLLALALVLTRRPGLNRFVRSAAAALLVPALAVVVVCLGAQLLEASGSPVVLPIIAVIVAVTLPATKAIESVLVARGLDARNAASVRLWIEISSLVTAAIAVLLALVREAAGLGTAFTVLVVLGLGAAATSVFTGRRYGWPLAGASWTGALWCVWAMLGVDVVEPYTLPPAIGAAVVAAILIARRGRGFALFTSALASAIVPSLLILGAWGSGDAAFAWRTAALIAASVALLLLGRLLTPGAAVPTTGVRMLRAPVLAVGLVAASAGAIQSVRFGLERDPIPLADADLVMLPALGLSLAAAALAVAAAALLGRGAARSAEPTAVDRWMLHTRWLFAPALVFLVAGPISAIRRDWFAIWTLWTLMAMLLVLAVVTVARARRARAVLPPFAFTYVLAWVTGVAGWSERDLRVEVFSIPLGLAVLAAGVLAMRPPTLPTRPTLASWPVGFTGSWRVLAPGIVLTFLPSVLATGTDPQLYRPILVIALALIAILVGSTRKLAAPFILGLAVLPIENVVVFAAQLDRTVGAMPWWITLATAGAVLLAIAVGSERRTTQGRGVAARLRELQ